MQYSTDTRRKTILMPPSKYVESYTPYLLDLFIQASKETFEQTFWPLTAEHIPLKKRYETPYNAAQAQRQKLYNLRAALRHENHPMYFDALRVQFRLKQNPDGSVLFIAESVDNHLIQGLLDAGLKSTAPEAPIPTHIEE